MSANTPLNNLYADPNVAAINIKSFGGIALQNASDAVNHAVAQITNANKNPTAQGAIYFPPHTYTIKTSCTIPAGVRVVMEKGAVFSVDSGKTLTIAGPLDAPLSQVFSGSGTVSLTGPIEYILPQWWGAVGDGDTNCTTAIQAAITAAAGQSWGSGTVTRGATVYFAPGQYKTTATLSLDNCRGVRLLGANWTYGSGFWGESTIKGTSTTLSLIDVGTTNNTQITIEKLTLAGSTSSPGTSSKDCHAITGTDCDAIRLIDLNIHGWGGSAVKLLSCFETYFEHVQATGCMFAYGSVTSNTGVIHLTGTEHTFFYCNINGPFGDGVAGQYTSGYVAGIFVDGSPVQGIFTTAAYCEVGWHFGTSVGTGRSSLYQCRADFNQGHGFWVEGADVGFTRCVAYTCGLAADATYSGFNTVKGASQFVIRNDFSNCIVDSASAGYLGNTNRMLYGFTDTNTSAGNTTILHNRYDALCRIGSNMAAAARVFNFTGAIVPAWDGLRYRQALTGSTATTTFDGEEGNLWVLTCASGQATEVNAENLVAGQEYTLYIIQHATPGTVTLASEFTKVQPFISPAASKHLSCRFYSDGTSLYQVGGWSGDT